MKWNEKTHHNDKTDENEREPGPTLGFAQLLPTLFQVRAFVLTAGQKRREQKSAPYS